MDAHGSIIAHDMMDEESVSDMMNEVGEIDKHSAALKRLINDDEECSRQLSIAHKHLYENLTDELRVDSLPASHHK